MLKKYNPRHKLTMFFSFPQQKICSHFPQNSYIKIMTGYSLYECKMNPDRGKDVFYTNSRV
jgi:hypothetical protein